MIDRHGENGDALFYDEDCLERRRSYKEDEMTHVFPSTLTTLTHISLQL